MCVYITNDLRNNPHTYKFQCENIRNYMETHTLPFNLFVQFKIMQTPCILTPSWRTIKHEGSRVKTHSIIIWILNEKHNLQRGQFTTFSILIANKTRWSPLNARLIALKNLHERLSIDVINFRSVFAVDLLTTHPDRSFPTDKRRNYSNSQGFAF